MAAVDCGWLLLIIASFFGSGYWWRGVLLSSRQAASLLNLFICADRSTAQQLKHACLDHDDCSLFKLVWPAVNTII
jgi:hypothetical protein